MKENLFLFFHSHNDIRSYEGLLANLSNFKLVGINTFFVEFSSKEKFGENLKRQIEKAEMYISQGMYPDGYNKEMSEFHLLAMKAEHDFFRVLEEEGFEIVCVDPQRPEGRGDLNIREVNLERIVDDNIYIEENIERYFENNPNKKAVGLFGWMHCLLADSLKCKGCLLNIRANVIDECKHEYPYTHAAIVKSLSDGTLILIDSSKIPELLHLEKKNKENTSVGHILKTGSPVHVSASSSASIEENSDHQESFVSCCGCRIL